MDGETDVGDDGPAVKRQPGVRDATVVSILIAVQLGWLGLLGYGLLTLLHY